MNPNRITIIPFIHGKLTRDGKMSEPDIYWMVEKWLVTLQPSEQRPKLAVNTGHRSTNLAVK